MKDHSMLNMRGISENKVLSENHDQHHSILLALNKIRGVHGWVPCSGKLSESMPDIISCVDGKFVAFVIASSRKQPDYAQRRMMREITEAGGQVFIVRSVKEAIAAIHEIRDEFWMYDEDQSRCWEEFDD